MRYVVALDVGLDRDERNAEAVSVVVCYVRFRLQHRSNIVRDAGRRRCDVIKKAAVFVIGEKQCRIRPVRAAEQGVDSLCHRGLSYLEVGWRVLVRFRSSVSSEGGLKEYDLRKRLGLQVDVVIGQDGHLVDVGDEHRKEETGDRQVAEIVLPTDPVVVELFEDRELGEFIGRAREIVSDVAERSSGEQEKTIREGGAQHRAEVAITNR